MVIHIQPKERTQERSRKRKFILERQSHCMPPWGHLEGVLREQAVDPVQVGRRQREEHMNQGRCFNGGQGGVRTQRM